MLQVHPLRALKDNFIYALTDGQGRCAVIDPGESAPVAHFLKGHNLRLTHILCTHHHHDHVGGVADLVAQYGCEVAGSAKDIELKRIPHATITVSEKQPLQMWDRTVEILEVPGHTLGQICYFLREEKALFPGDTLFSAGCGRLFEGTPAQMFASLKKIKDLPSDTQIFFGHEYTLRNLEFVLQEDRRPEVMAYKTQVEEKIARGEDTTPTLLKTELQVNPFLRAQDVAEFARWRETRNHF